jgi:hypothetical protein
MQRQSSGFHANIDAPQLDALTPVRYRRFRRRFFVALFIGMVGLAGFLIVLVIALYG